MFNKKLSLCVFSALLSMLLMTSTTSASPLNAALGTSFTDQGKLTDNRAPAADQQGISFPQNSVYGIGAYADVTYFYDDFESYAENSYPSSFTQIYNGCGDAEQKVLTTTGYAGAESKVFRLLGCSSWASEQYVSLPSPLPASLVLDAYVKPVSGNWPGAVRLRNPSGDWGTTISDVVFDTGGNITAGGLVIGAYTAGTWYRVTMEHNITQKIYNVYINGIKAAENINMHPTLSPTQIDLVAGNHDTSEMYFDNVGLYDSLVNLFQCTPPPSGMVSWWSGDNNALDMVGGNNGTLMGDATYASGMVGEAFSFDGVNDYVTVPDSSVWAFGTNDFSIDLWTNFNSVRSGSYGLLPNVFVGQDEGSGSYKKWVFYLADDGLNFHTNGSASVFIGHIPFSPITGQWYHLSLTRSGSTYSFYVNGTLLGTASDTTPAPDVNAPLTIGQAEERGYFDGLIDEVEIFNRALSADEIVAIYNAGSAGKCKPDTIPPTVVSVIRADLNPTNVTSVNFTVTFSESVTGVDTADFAPTKTGTIAGESVDTVTGGPTVYTVTVNTGSGDGTLRLDVTDDDTIVDLALNPLGGAGVANGDFTTGETYDIDKTAPTVTMASLASDPTNASPIAVTVQFSETVTGFDASDILPSNGTVSNFMTVDGDTYTFDLAPSAQGLVTADIAAGVASDLAGNGNAMANQFSRTYDPIYKLFLPLIQQ